jgi:hypothetical protein
MSDQLETAATRFPAHFQVAADSRHPKLTDYTQAAHAYTDAYVHPAFYGISVEDFPGMILVEPRGDQQSNPRQDNPTPSWKTSTG